MASSFFLNREEPASLGYFLADSARVENDAVIGQGTRVWHLAQIREGARLGRDSTIGRGVYIGPGVSIGDRCKVQNGAMLFEPAQLGDGVFVGPGAILANDRFPRAINVDGSLKGPADWELVGVVVGEGASIGANVTCVGPVKIGSWALIGAGSVVTEDVPKYALVIGAPARRIGWVGRHGHPLTRSGTFLVCPSSGEKFRETEEGIEPC
jgi:acetyltransferase-like isoleucine patch superfamily enzyme